jgi:phage shock protein PspC (stress-responsive transcriptional regulator)
MKKSININIAGIVFQIDDDAFEKLRSYLQEVNVRFSRIPGGHEALDDFEARVAEIFQNRRGITGIVTMEDIDEMISIMGRPEDIADDYEDEIPEQPVSSFQRRLYRNPDERIISGVAGGIGSYINVDPVWIRLLFILFSLFYGFGFFVYIALWIALPLAYSERRKQELYGNRYGSDKSGHRRRSDRAYGRPAGADTADRVGGALNEIFRAIGRFIVIFFRIILIIIGVSLIITGLTFLAMAIMALFFNYGPWLPGSAATETFYFSELFPLIITPSAIPWFIVLSLIVLALPLMGLIYWGVKMIFQFRAKDGIISIIALSIWIITAVALTMLLFSEGISFAESGRQIERIDLDTDNNSIVLAIGKDLSATQYENKIDLPFEDNFSFFTTVDDKIFCSARAYIRTTSEEVPFVEIKRYAQGASRRKAIANAENLEYNYSFRNDSLIVDSYFGLPDKTRWRGSDVRLHLYLPEGTRIFIDRKAGSMITRANVPGHNSWDMGGRWWIMTENGLTPN